MLRSLEGDKIECMVRLDFTTTNNESEYEALLAGLDLAKAAGAISSLKAAGWMVLRTIELSKFDIQ